MSAYRDTHAKPLQARAKHLAIAGALLIAVALLAGAWLFPPTADAGETPSVSVSVNVPLNDIQDGQFCQAYAVVHGGSPPYYFEWDGQFDNSDVDCGFCRLGPNQVVNGFIDRFQPNWLEVRVYADSTKENLLDDDTAPLNIDPEHEYNEECEA